MFQFHVLLRDFSSLMVGAASIEEVERAFPTANITNMQKMSERIIKFPL